MDIGKDLQNAFNDGYKQGRKDLKEKAIKELEWLKGFDNCDMLMVYEVIDTIKDIFDM